MTDATPISPIDPERNPALATLMDRIVNHITNLCDEYQAAHDARPAVFPFCAVGSDLEVGNTFAEDDTQDVAEILQAIATDWLEDLSGPATAALAREVH